MSDLEAAFDTYWRMVDGPDLTPEHRFAAEIVGAGPGLRSRLDAAGLRDWRFDRAHVPAMVAVELEGGVWSNGRHTRPAGFEGDCMKYNAAAAAGWLVFRLTGNMLETDPLDHLWLIADTIRRR